MSKKQERIKYLVGLRNTINQPTISPDTVGYYAYEVNTVKSLLATIDHLLKEDGIVGIPANSKVNN